MVKEAATFWNLEPATVYTFSVRTEKEGFKDSAPDIKEIQTGTAMLAYQVLFSVHIFISLREALVNSTFFLDFLYWPAMSSPVCYSVSPCRAEHNLFRACIAR